jgi:hypothetical protein
MRSRAVHVKQARRVWLTYGMGRWSRGHLGKDPFRCSRHR